MTDRQRQQTHIKQTAQEATLAESGGFHVPLPPINPIQQNCYPSLSPSLSPLPPPPPPTKATLTDAHQSPSQHSFGHCYLGTCGHGRTPGLRPFALPSHPSLFAYLLIYFSLFAYLGPSLHCPSMSRILDGMGEKTKRREEWWDGSK